MLSSGVVPYWNGANVARFHEKSLPELKVALPVIEGADYVNDDQLCMTCHETYVATFAHNVHRRQKCEDCHGPASRHLITRGKEPGLILNFKKLPKAQASEICLKCHEQTQCEPNARWRNSVHAHQGVSCTDCHSAHYNVPAGTQPNDTLAQSRLPPLGSTNPSSGQPAEIDQEFLRAESNHLGAISPQVCYRCHSGMQQFETLAHPHQILGPNGFTCNICHDPHGNVRNETRSDLCLKCHDGAPTMAWHSSVHSHNGVACTDCHNPHPSTFVTKDIGIQHTNIVRPSRLPMSVDDPGACYKCHQQIYALNALPSHHPIQEGKVVCSDCHDAHGQAEGNLREATINEVCYRCHADKQGPFAYEHPPATENCAICHEPHGTVANNLLRQPASFLCLRCHSGHRVGSFGPHTGVLVDVGTNVNQQKAFFSDCTECHAQVHGSDLPSPHNPGSLLR
jgi:DmsE family decaheme c-type cytochrome